MLLALLPAVLDNARFRETVFTVPSANRRLRAALEGLASPPRLVDWPFEKRRAEPYLHRFRMGYRSAVRRLVIAERPDTVLLVQGRIENCAVPMTNVPRGPRLVSYLPMAHLMSEMGRGALGDRARHRLYARPDGFIVPSQAVAEQVRRAGGTAPITVAHNVVSPPVRTEQGTARATLGLSNDRRIALFLGRLDSAQKGLDLLLAAISQGGAKLAAWTFVFVGDGPGRAAIEAAAGGTADVRSVPWTDRPDLYLSAADVLLLPSRWEGLPLVMLEAMVYGLPILASGIDVYHDYLPERNRVDFAKADLGEALAAVTTSDAKAQYERRSSSKLAPLTLAAARARFADALLGKMA